MKYPIANITVEGQGWNPYWLAATGLSEFQKLVLADGHYLRGGDDIPLTEEQRKAVAKVAYDKAVAFVAEAKGATPALAQDAPPPPQPAKTSRPADL